MFLAKLSSNGQITVPKEIKEELGLVPGDRILFKKNDKGEIVISNSSKNYNIDEGNNSFILEEEVQRLEVPKNASVSVSNTEEMLSNFKNTINIEKQINFLKGLPFVGYNKELKKTYLEYPDGRIVYEEE